MDYLGKVVATIIISKNTILGLFSNPFRFSLIAKLLHFPLDHRLDCD
jgi:hypothetical protein